MWSLNTENYIASLKIYLEKIEPPKANGKNHDKCVQWAFAKAIMATHEAGYDIAKLDWFKYYNLDAYLADKGLTLNKDKGLTLKKAA